MLKLLPLSLQRLLWLLLLLPRCLQAQDAETFAPDSIRKSIEAVKITGNLRIDGQLRENEWLLAPRSPRFTQIEPFQGKAPSFDTEVKVLYNKQFLYFGIFAQDPGGKKALRAVDFKRDFMFNTHDLVGLAFDGFNDRRNAMVMATNPYGAQRDLLSFDDTYYDIDWDGLWRVRTSRTDSGWFSEIAIPWQTLRYPGLSDSIQSWGFNIYRNRRLTNESTALSPYPRAFSAVRMSYAGILNNLQPPPPKPNVRVQPYLLTSFNKNREDGIKTGEATSIKAGGEVKWAINPNAVLDLTFNTDFAQADADRLVNNVTRFSVFFPERRQFFLENASLFGIGISKSPDESGGNMRIQPFFSRRIGLDDAGNPIPIEAGGRYVYRSLKRNYGAIAMRQAGKDNAPATNFFVGRYSENFGKENRIGTLVTLKNQPQGTHALGSVDAFFRLGPSHSLNTMVSYSNSTSTGKRGMSAYAQYFYINNQFKIWWTQSIVTRDYDPQMGFVSRKDVVATTPGIFWWYRGQRLPFRKWLRAWEPSILSEFYHQASTGNLIERTWYLFPIWLNLQSGAYFGYGATPTYQLLTEPFEPLGVLIDKGRYHYLRHIIYASSDPSRKINLQVLYNWGTYFNGRLQSGDWTLQFAPAPHFSLSAKFNRNRFVAVGQVPVTKNVDLYALEGRFALNPRLQLIGIYQYNVEEHAKNYNIRLSWEYQPLSYIYIVLNRRTFQTLSFKNRVDDQLIAKISFLKQF